MDVQINKTQQKSSHASTDVVKRSSRNFWKGLHNLHLPISVPVKVGQRGHLLTAVCKTTLTINSRKVKMAPPTHVVICTAT